jgi:diacylglycerol kinase family enzyme
MSLPPPSVALPPRRAHVLIVANPRAGARSGRSAADRLQRLLRAHGFSVDVLTDGESLQAAAESVGAGGALRAVVAAGGDGTAAMVANQTPQGTPIALLPLGTENLLAKHLGVTANPESVCRAIRCGATIRLDAGQADGRIFLLMAGCGFDADVVRRLHTQRKGNIRRLSYAKPILDAIRSYQYPELRVYCKATGDRDIEREGRGDKPDASSRLPIRARWVFVANLPRYGAGLRIVPNASGTDGLLDVCTLRNGSFWSLLRYLGGVILGRHQSWKDCVSLRTRQLRIESDDPVPYQLDGDPGGSLPLEISVLPERLTVVVPENSTFRPRFRSARHCG